MSSEWVMIQSLFKTDYAMNQNSFREEQYYLLQEITSNRMFLNRYDKEKCLSQVLCKLFQVIVLERT